MTRLRYEKHPGPLHGLLAGVNLALHYAEYPAPLHACYLLVGHTAYICLRFIAYIVFLCLLPAYVRLRSTAYVVFFGFLCLLAGLQSGRDQDLLMHMPLCKCYRQTRLMVAQLVVALHDARKQDGVAALVDRLRGDAGIELAASSLRTRGLPG